MSIWAILVELPSKEKFCSLLTGKKMIDKENEHVFKVSNKFVWKRWKIITICTEIATFYC